ncbi:MAG: hypothetical protein R3F59_23240 [Myxococcota bacterium]
MEPRNEVGTWRASDRPQLRWGDDPGLGDLVRAASDAVLAPLAVCDLVLGGVEGTLLREPDGTTRAVRLAGLGLDAVGRALRALIFPDAAALGRYAAARAEDPVLELALAGADGRLAPEAVDAVLANLVRARLVG